MNRVTPSNIVILKENEIFVFGSNNDGKHFGGAARVAAEKFGAIIGQGFGMQGQSFAIDTMSGINQIEFHVQLFIETARNSDLTFLVTEVGCGIAGYAPEEIAPLFKDAIAIENIHLPEKFWNILNNHK